MGDLFSYRWFSEGHLWNNELLLNQLLSFTLLPSFLVMDMILNSKHLIYTQTYQFLGMLPALIPLFRDFVCKGSLHLWYPSIFGTTLRSNCARTDREKVIRWAWSDGPFGPPYGSIGPPKPDPPKLEHMSSGSGLLQGLGKTQALPNIHFGVYIPPSASGLLHQSFELSDEWSVNIPLN